MKPVRTGIAVTCLLMIFGTLAACGGPPVTNPAASSPLPTSVVQPTSVGGGEAGSDATPAGAAAAADQTCGLFRQMVEGVDTLSTRELQALVDDMADAVQYTGNVELMRGVVDIGEGWLNSDPQQFAHGMRTLSAECNIPYE